MLSHLMAFIFYTFAMVGVLLVAFIVYKKFNLPFQQNKKGLIDIIDSCPLGPKKNLMIVKVGNEKFFIASGAEHTTLLAKLDNNFKVTEKAESIPEIKQNNFEIEQMPAKQNNQEEIYNFLYNQSKKLEKQNADIIDENYKLQQARINNQNKLKELYMSDVEKKNNLSLESRRKVMQELLDEIHQKNKIGSRF